MSKKYPIAETFFSPQGEGLYTGAMMFFIRMAGCSVGKKLSGDDQKRFLMEFDVESQRKGMPILNNLPVYREKCTLYDGREFLCDTDFRTKETHTAEALSEMIPPAAKRVCLTGGEPMNHNLAPLMLEITKRRPEVKVHVETSGTVSMTEHALKNYEPIDSDDEGGWLWITVSPKFGVRPEMVGLANEIKLLVDKDFDEEKLPDEIMDHRLVWIQPVNEEFTVDRENLDRCLELIQKHPNWRLSTQMHKIWKVR